MLPARFPQGPKRKDPVAAGAGNGKSHPGAEIAEPGDRGHRFCDQQGDHKNQGGAGQQQNKTRGTDIELPEEADDKQVHQVDRHGKGNCGADRERRPLLLQQVFRKQKDARRKDKLVSAETTCYAGGGNRFSLQ